MANGEPWPATTHQIAAWAIHKKLWAAKTSSLIDQCADHLARALREAYITDPQGRKVWVKHAARIKQGKRQLTLWADIRTDEPKYMQIALQQRRQQILGDCHQLKTDVDSYNQNWNPGRKIQMVFDFTTDLAEYDGAGNTAA